MIGKLNLNQYKLLYNNLWLIDPVKAQQLNIHVSFGRDWLSEGIKPSRLENTNENNIAVHLVKPAIDKVNTITRVKDLELKPVEIDKESSKNLIPEWDALVSEVNSCSKCDLCHGRQNVVIERGNRSAKWMLIGEGPGEQEDIQGKPFVGASGQLLQKMLGAMNLNPDTDVYICNVVKCRPPSNRNPELAEINACKNYLFSQIALVKPQIIITLGRFAAQTLLNTTKATGRLRGDIHKYQDIPLIVTYHPSYLLRNPAAKKDAWADLQLAMKTFTT